MDDVVRTLLINEDGQVVAELLGDCRDSFVEGYGLSAVVIRHLAESDAEYDVHED